MIKRMIDIVISFAGLLIFSPLIGLFTFLIWSHDKHSPIYIAKRVGKDGKPINVYKMRSMVVNADKKGGDSTSADDIRITNVGRIVRAYKIDEILQLWNVLIGSMSLVGPRPNVQWDVDLYKQNEKELLTVRPGITDFSSIIFSDEGEILKDKPDPDLAFSQLIRPWKIRLGLFYIEKQSTWIDLQLIILTIVAIFSKEKVLGRIVKILKIHNAAEDLICVSRRDSELEPYLSSIPNAS